MRRKDSGDSTGEEIAVNVFVGGIHDRTEEGSRHSKVIIKTGCNPMGETDLDVTYWVPDIVIGVYVLGADLDKDGGGGGGTVGVAVGVVVTGAV